jgi:hypothetical protein
LFGFEGTTRLSLVAGFRPEFLAWRGTNDAHLTIGLYMALWEAAGRPSRARAFKQFLQVREQQRRA